jgi:predicted Zn-dependent peptidase
MQRHIVPRIGPPAAIACFLMLALSLTAQTFDAMKARVRERTLSNGMKWIVLERKDAPVASFHVYADVGSANEVDGITGIAHILEHMAFKGTRTVGTKDFAKELIVLNRLDSLNDAIVREEIAVRPDTVRLAADKKRFDGLRQQAQEFVVVNEFIDLLMKEGEPNPNAFTSNDATQYINSLPSNRLEFWMSLTSDRFLNPVFREFYKERDVVIEERRLRIETQPIPKLLEDVFASAYKAHPYHHMVIGHMSDLKRITHEDVKDFFAKYYMPSNLVAAVVGNVNPDEVFRQAELYFGRIPGGPKPEGPRTVEPEQWGERRVQVVAQSQPVLVMGYHRPGIRDKDNQAFDAMANIIGQGRSSRLYRLLVKEKKIAVDAGSFNGWPGSKYPNLIAYYAIPSKDHTTAECFDVISAEIENLKTAPITADELTKYKRSTKKGLLDAMKANDSMASMLANTEVLEGDWRKAFDGLRQVDAVTADDIQRLAKKVLVSTNRTVGEIVPETPQGKGQP